MDHACEHPLDKFALLQKGTHLLAPARPLVSPLPGLPSVTRIPGLSLLVVPTLNSPATPWAARVNILEELGKWDWEVTNAACSHTATVTEPGLGAAFPGDPV